MTNTIELLEAIGRDASLRRASAEDLSQALVALKASEALKLAVIEGDAGYLAQELGHRDIQTTNSVNNGFGDGSDDGDGDGDSDGGSGSEEDEDLGKSG